MIKLQHMSVIFIIIMIPIILVLSFYISTQIDTINLQTQYDTKLNDSTHDAMEAFQMNTRNNEYSTVADSLKRDVQAAVNTFYTSLASNMGQSGYTKEELQPYIPAILCTMYDGYYISSPTKTQLNSDSEDLLKQYTYYTARYSDDNNTNVVINYSLDSYISVYGNVEGNYVAKSGYLIQYGSSGLTAINNIPISSFSYNSTSDRIETTGYYIKDGAIWDSNGPQEPLSSVVYNGQTINAEGDAEDGIVVKNDKNQYEEKPNAKEALYYYLEAYEFSKYMESIGLNAAINAATRVEINDVPIFGGGANNQITQPYNIFNFTGSDEKDDPENLLSNFVNHKREIIRFSIENSLQTAFNNFEGVTTYDYQLPKLTEEDWEKVYKNVSFITFMQGLQVGSKIYNNYSVVTSTGNEEYVDPEEIYFIDNSASNTDYHRIDDITLASGDKYVGYRSNMYLQQSKIIGKDPTNGEDVERITGTGSSGYILREIAGKTVTADYSCIVNANYTSVYGTQGKLLENITGKQVLIYYTALARERYCLKKTKATSILNATETIKTNVYLSGSVQNLTTGTITGKMYPEAAFPLKKYKIESIEDLEERTSVQVDDKTYENGEEATIDGLEQGKKYKVTIVATDQYGKSKKDSITLNTGKINFTKTESWKNGYIELKVTATNIQNDQTLYVDSKSATQGEGTISVGGLNTGDTGSIKVTKIENSNENKVASDNYEIKSKDETGPTVHLEEKDIKIKENNINFTIEAEDWESGFNEDTKFKIGVYESNQSEESGEYFEIETNTEVNKISRDITIPNLKPYTEYYMIIKIADRLGNETEFDTRKAGIKIKTENKQQEAVPDAIVVVNPDDEDNAETNPGVDLNANIVVKYAPTSWVDGEKQGVQVTLETKNLEQDKYTIEYISASDYNTGNWKEYTSPITIMENSGYFVRLAQVVDGKKITGKQSQSFNISNIDRKEPIISWKGNPSSASKQDINLIISAKDQGIENSGIKSFKINGVEYATSDSYNATKNEGTKILSQTVTAKENTTIDVQIEDCVGRTKQETIKVENIDKTLPQVELTETSNSNYIDARYANKDATIVIKIKAQDTNLQYKQLTLDDFIVKVDNKEVALVSQKGVAGKAYAYTTYYVKEEDGNKVQYHIIELNQITGNGNLTLELKEGAVKDTAGNANNKMTYSTGIIMDNMAPTMNAVTNKTIINNTGKKATIVTNGKDERAGVYQYSYEIKDVKDLKEKIMKETSADRYTFNATFGIYPIAVQATDRAGNVTTQQLEMKDYDIVTKEDMVYFQKYVNTGTTFSGETINLRNDVNLECDENNQWTPIGGTGSTTFSGTFEGNNHEISGMYINYTGEYADIGLFGYNAGIIKNLGVDGEITGQTTWLTADIGGIAGTNRNQIINCYNKATITGYGSAFVGGIAGISWVDQASIKNCYNLGTIESENGYAGGIAGNSHGMVEECYNLATIKSGRQAGGIIGENYGKVVRKCYNNGIIESKIYAGGVIGSAGQGTERRDIIAECYNTGEIKGGNAGGIVGKGNQSIEIIQNCYNTGIVQTTDGYAGGIAGSYYGGHLVNCYNNGKVVGNNSIGGIIGILGNDSEVSNTYYLEGTATGGINGQDVAGQAEAKKASEMKNPHFVQTLGADNWKEDTIPINGKYPILKWQEGKETVIVTVENATTNSIQVSAYVTDKNVRESSTTQYEYYIGTSDGNYSLKKKTTDKNYTFTGLKQNQTYYIKVVARNDDSYYYTQTNGGIYQGSEMGQTGEVVVSQGNITFSIDPSDWTNGNVRVSMSSKVMEGMSSEGYKLQYQVGSMRGEWIDYSTTFTIEQNTIIYGRIVDSTNQANGYATCNIQNIDKTRPMVTAKLNENKINITVKDTESGVRYWGVTNSANQPSTTQNGNITSSSKVGVWEQITASEQKEVTFTITGSGTYYIWAKDQANNVNDNTNNLTRITILENDITFSTPTWSNEKASVVVSTQQTNAKLQYSLDNTNWTTVSGTSKTVSSLLHGNTVYARLIDGTNTSEVKQYTILDTVLPQATIAIVGETDESGNYTSDVTITFSALDDESGIQDMSYSIEGPQSISNTISSTIKTETLTQKGEYTITLTAADKAGNIATTTKNLRIEKEHIWKMIEGTTKITDGNVTVQVGDYVAYTPQDSITSYTIDKADSGYAYTKDYSQDSLNWRVLGINENGQLELISDDVTSEEVYFKGYQGYNNGVYLMNDMCNTLYSNSSNGSMARNVNIEDIQNNMNLNVWDYKTYEDYGRETKYLGVQHYYPDILAQEKGQSVNYAEGTLYGPSEQSQKISQTSKHLAAASSMQITQNYWHNWMGENNFKDPIYYNLFIKNVSYYNYYCLASRCVESNPGKANFGIWLVVNDSMWYRWLYTSINSVDTSSWYLRPVVILGSNIQIDTSIVRYNGSSVTNAWRLK